MDDILKKMKETESKASQIITDAENEAKKILENARLNASSKIKEFKKNRIQQNTAEKNLSIQNIIKEREKIINDKIEIFNNTLNKLTEKRIEAYNYLLDLIKSKLEI